MAHKKAGGSTRLGRDSQAKRLGVKKFGGDSVKPGDIIIRQRGTYFRNGTNTRLGKDHTIYSVATGIVNFKKKKVVSFSSKLIVRQIVSVISQAKTAAKKIN